MIAKKAIHLIAILATAALAGCAAPKPADEAPLQWAVLTDGSRFAEAPYHDSKDQGGVIRCWPQSRGFDCLSVFESKWREVLRQRFMSLPSHMASQLDRVVAGAGYRCSLSTENGGYQEEIRNKDAAKLTEHVYADFLAADATGWTADYVNGYFRANGLDAKTLYFNCRYLQDALRAGSLQTVGTSSIDYDSLTR